MKQLVLASASPRRREILRLLGVSFLATSWRGSELPYTRGQSFAGYVQKNAAAKALSVAQRFADALVVGADTVVVHRGAVLGKPRTMDEAFDFMRRLSGATHVVYTGIAIVDTVQGMLVQGYERTQVTFRRLSDTEIAAYLAVVNPLDKAGGYAIQGPGALIVERIAGCYYNVVGFPVARLDALLLEFGVSLFDYMHQRKGRNTRRRI
ncbi:MAG: Maf family protein [Desulfobacterota bacterium]|nr:Maf family protein [Thermodesulfobacteriota bacterium]